MALVISISLTNYSLILVIPTLIISLFNLILNVLTSLKHNIKKNSVFNCNPIDMYQVIILN